MERWRNKPIFRFVVRDKYFSRSHFTANYHPLIPDYYRQGRTTRNLLTYVSVGTNGSDVLLPTPLLLLPCHEQLRLISSYCFMRRAKCRFASLLFLSRLLSVTSNLSLCFTKVFISLRCDDRLRRSGTISRCFMRLPSFLVYLIITDNVIRIPPLRDIKLRLADF